ncbi:uncharacterized protein LOC135207093 [Macrobrachium nipponense]|uniref:uncharacterized protein LOC135207093 n=1 Tax=Macrobrachium nipponense TaxID=159736 RepID=UPI0030C7F55A
MCSPSHVGDHCEASADDLPGFIVSPGVLAAILSWIFVIISVVVVGGVIHKHFRQGRIHVKSLKNSVTLDFAGADDMTSHSLDITRNILSDDQVSAQPSPEVVDVDILNGGARDALQKRGGFSQTNHLQKKSLISSESSKTGCVCPHLPSVDDLRNYAYEGDGSSPGSLSSCCSGGDKIGERSFVGGFHDVATLLNCLGGQSTSSSPKLQRSSKQDKNSPPNKIQDASLPVLHLLHSPSRRQLTPDLTSSSSWINGILPNMNPTKKRDTDCLQKSIFHSSIKPKQPLLHDSKYNSLPKSKASHVFSNHIYEKGKTELNGAYHSLQRNHSVFHLPVKENVQGAADEHPGCSCKHKCSSSENKEGSCAREGLTRAKCDACVMDTLVQQGIHKRSFSASTVFFLSPAYTCNTATLPAPTASAQGNTHSCWMSDDPFYK